MGRAGRLPLGFEGERGRDMGKNQIILGQRERERGEEGKSVDFQRVGEECCFDARTKER